MMRFVTNASKLRERYNFLKILLDKIIYTGYTYIMRSKCATKILTFALLASGMFGCATGPYFWDDDGQLARIEPLPVYEAPEYVQGFTAIRMPDSSGTRMLDYIARSVGKTDEERKAIAKEIYQKN